MKHKITLTRKLIPLLKELDRAQSRFDQFTRQLAPGGDLDGRHAVDIGADREQVRSQILNLAGRINRVSKTQPEKI